MRRFGFANWMVFCLFMAPIMFCTVFLTGAMLCVGLWDPSIPWYYKFLTPFGVGLFWLEMVFCAWVLDKVT